MNAEEYVVHLSLGNTCREQEVKEGQGGGWGREGLHCICGALVGFWLTNLLLRGLDPSHQDKFHVTKTNGNEELCNY